MEKKEHWALNKFTKLLICQMIAVCACMFVVLTTAPTSETLLNVNRERLFLYSIIFGFSLILVGEVFGLFVENTKGQFLGKRLVLTIASSGIACLGLLLIVWIIEFDFIGRFIVLKIVSVTGFSCYIFLFFQDLLSRRTPWRVWASFEDEKIKKIKSYVTSKEDEIHWVDSKKTFKKNTLINFCNKNGIDIILLKNDQPESKNIDIMGLLSSGVRVLEVESFIETFCQKIPPSEVDDSWLTKLDLRQRDPILRRVKRLIDIFFSIFGLLISLPILFIMCIAIVIESGFPIFFSQTRTGHLGKKYVLYKLRTMSGNAEINGAKWAQVADDRVTRVGRFLRKWRIDEIPQFWNVIKGDMSIVGPRPERPELDKEIIKRLPFWKCRYLLKPGLTGWAQIRYKYASDIESSEEKLAYDLFYVKNASIFLDLEIMLSTLRSLTKGSR